MKRYEEKEVKCLISKPRGLLLARRRWSLRRAGGNFHPTGTWGDVGFSRNITNNRQTNRLNVPTFNIYLPGRKSYINFGPNSIMSDY